MIAPSRDMAATLYIRVYRHLSLYETRMRPKHRPIQEAPDFIGAP